jgi:hypothetical protein
MTVATPEVHMSFLDQAYDRSKFNWTFCDGKGAGGEGRCPNHTKEVPPKPLGVDHPIVKTLLEGSEAQIRDGNSRTSNRWERIDASLHRGGSCLKRVCEQTRLTKEILDHETEQSQTTIDEETQGNEDERETEGAEGTERAETPPLTVGNEYDEESLLESGSEKTSSDAEASDAETPDADGEKPEDESNVEAPRAEMPEACKLSDLGDEIAALKAAQHKSIKGLGKPVKCEKILQQVSTYVRS